MRWLRGFGSVSHVFHARRGLLRRGIVAITSHDWDT
jgi:hypothetical protein